MSAGATESSIEAAGTIEAPGWESTLTRWLPRAALVGVVGVGALWWASTSAPLPSPHEQGRKQKDDVSEDAVEAAGWCADCACESLDCAEGLGECSACDCGACDCGAIDCGGCDCGGFDCATAGGMGLNGGGLSVGALRGVVGPGGLASGGGSCPTRRAGWLSVAALAAPVALIALWRARAPRG